MSDSVGGVAEQEPDRAPSAQNFKIAKDQRDIFAGRWRVADDELRLTRRILDGDEINDVPTLALMAEKRMHDLAAVRADLLTTRADRDNFENSLTEASEVISELRAALAKAPADALREARDQAMRGHANDVTHWLSAYIAEQSGIAARAAAMEGKTSE